MCCMSSILNIYRILLDFLHFAKDFAQNIQNHTKENETENVFYSHWFVLTKLGLIINY